jgi:hypothetical protein
MLKLLSFSKPDGRLLPRALFGIDQQVVAHATCLGITTTRKMEACGPGPLQGRADTDLALAQAQHLQDAIFSW